MHHGTCVTRAVMHAGSLKRGCVKTFPAHAQAAILHIWQDAHRSYSVQMVWRYALLNRNIWLSYAELEYSKIDSSIPTITQAMMLREEWLVSLWSAFAHHVQNEMIEFASVEFPSVCLVTETKLPWRLSWLVVAMHNNNSALNAPEIDIWCFFY